MSRYSLSCRIMKVSNASYEHRYYMYMDSFLNMTSISQKLEARKVKKFDLLGIKRKKKFKRMYQVIQLLSFMYMTRRMTVRCV